MDYWRLIMNINGAKNFPIYPKHARPPTNSLIVYEGVLFIWGSRSMLEFSWMIHPIKTYIMSHKAIKNLWSKCDHRIYDLPVKKHYVGVTLSLFFCIVCFILVLFQGYVPKVMVFLGGMSFVKKWRVCKTKVTKKNAVCAFSAPLWSLIYNSPTSKLTIHPIYSTLCYFLVAMNKTQIFT